VARQQTIGHQDQRLDFTAQPAAPWDRCRCCGASAGTARLRLAHWCCGLVAERGALRELLVVQPVTEVDAAELKGRIGRRLESRPYAGWSSCGEPAPSADLAYGEC